MLSKIAKSSWQTELSNMITDPKELWDILALPPALLEKAYAASTLFPLKVTHSYIARMQKGDINDPLLRQILPLGEELLVVNGYVNDPLAEEKVNPLPGLLHKYHGRVLVTLTSACAVHCRYCFRKNFPYEDNNAGSKGLDKIIEYIKNDSSIKEVILSGGDPLTVSDHLLKSFAEKLENIPTLTTLRIHTRLPIVLPSRITTSLCNIFSNLKLKVVMVVHSNHANEINHEVAMALKLLRKHDVHLLNQTVLLKGVNDNAETLAALSEALFNVDVLPYYLHTLDKVSGTHHFDYPQEKAMLIYNELLAKLPGYLVPTLVCEEPGMTSKTRL